MAKLLYETRDRIAYLTLNRPEAKNAIDPELHELLWEAWEDFAADESADVAILTGAGDAFSAGADLKTYIPPIIKDSTPRWVRDNVATGLGGLTRGLHRIPKPTIAAVNGWALAGGLETALACDIRIASERAMFGSFEARRGYHHGDGGIVRLVNVCGAGIALELLPAAEQVARQILRNSQVAVRSAKETILDVIGRPLDDQLRIEALNAYACADPEETLGLLQRFYDRTDEGRAG